LREAFFSHAGVRLALALRLEGQRRILRRMLLRVQA
jgi:hypothetical protein